MSLGDLQALWFEASLFGRTPSGGKDKTEELLITFKQITSRHVTVAGIHKAINHRLI